MSGQDTGQPPKGGLTWRQEKAVVVAAAAPLVPLFIVLAILFPDLPQGYPFIGAALAQVFIVLPFQGLRRPVEQPRLARFLAAVDLAALAIMPGVATIIQATGWTEPDILEFAVGFGGTLLIIGVVQQWLFRAMIERHDHARDEEERQT